MHIKIKKGLDIPISGKPSGNPVPLKTSSHVSLNLDPFDDIFFKILVQIGDAVKIGQPIAEDKNTVGRYFVSPAAGKVTEIRRGLKRRLLDIVIEVDPNEQYLLIDTVDIENTSKDAILNALKKGGIFAKIHSRPFNHLANPDKLPRNIFVKAVESAPFIPDPKFQVEGYEKEFQAGLNALSKLTTGKVHLVYTKDTTCKAFVEAKNVEKHTVEGPHPVSNYSLHIQEIDPVIDFEDTIWTLNAHDVVCMGYLLTTGKVHIHKVIGVGGTGIIPEQAKYLVVRDGISIESISHNRLKTEAVRLVSGDPLMGKQVSPTDFLNYGHFAFCAIPDNDKRKFLHFFRVKSDNYSMSKAYVSGHLNNENRSYDFNTSLHGEERPFIDGSLYDKVMPLNVSSMTLVKAVMAEDFDRAQELGLLDVDSEDFALPTFVCPSKIEMTDIIKNGLRANAKEIFG